MEIYNGKCCVYVHTNKINGKKYVGQTSIKPERRWNNGNGYKTQPYFYRAIQKYGWDNFDHEIISSGLTQEEADNFEILLIDKLNTLDNRYGYNTCSGGRIGGHPQTEETRKKMSETRTGKKLSDYHRQRISEGKMGEKNPMYGVEHTDEWKEYMKNKMQYENNASARSVCQYTKDGTLIKEWSCIKRASDELKISYNDILKCCSKKEYKGVRHRTVGGFVWIYKGDKFEKPSPLNCKPVVQYSLDGKIIKKWNSTSEAARENGISRSKITDCCRGEKEIVGGYHWEYYTEN